MVNNANVVNNTTDVFPWRILLMIFFNVFFHIKKSNNIIVVNEKI